MYHHVSPLLSNGTLLVFSGVYISTETSNPTLSPLSTIYTLDTTSSTATWQTITVPGTVPIPRRGASATLNADGTIFIFGGADVDFSQVYGDGWVFNPTTLAFTEVLTLSSGKCRWWLGAGGLLLTSQVPVRASTTVAFPLATIRSSSLEVS